MKYCITLKIKRKKNKRMSFYLINKDKDCTSHDVVSKLKKKLNIKKAGHSGTLDPFATGLLIIATDGDTKFLNRFLNEKKRYQGEFLFGKTTDTLDIDGVVKNTSDKIINFDDLEKIIGKFFIGKILQKPPIYSSIKINGKKSYDLARKGIEVNHDFVERQIYHFKVKELSKNKFWFDIEVSSGTYIRSIVRDIAEKLNNFGMVTKLERVSIGTISLKKADKIKDELKEYSVKDILNIDNYNISDEQMKHVLEGKILELNLNKKGSYIKEIIFSSKDAKVLMRVIGLNKFIIKKRIE